MNYLQFLEHLQPTEALEDKYIQDQNDPTLHQKRNASMQKSVLLYMCMLVFTTHYRHCLGELWGKLSLNES